jgi:hypothetical protein
MKSLSCPNKHRPGSGKGDVGAILRHGFYTTRSCVCQVLQNEFMIFPGLCFAGDRMITASAEDRATRARDLSAD